MIIFNALSKIRLKFILGLSIFLSYFFIGFFNDRILKLNKIAKQSIFGF